MTPCATGADAVGVDNGSLVFFEFVAIEKHPVARWRARALELADMNGDGKLDIMGALIHRDSSVPTDKVALFWMEQHGNGWLTNIVTWGDGLWEVGAPTARNGIR